MWVILVSKHKEDFRDNFLSDILDLEKSKEPDTFLSKRGNRYHLTGSLSNAVIYKQKSSCERLIKRFYGSDRSTYRNGFYWIKDLHISYKRITKEEWNKMCNLELDILERQYQKQRYDIEKKRTMIK